MDPSTKPSRSDQLDLFGAETSNNDEGRAIWAALPEEARREVLRLVVALLRGASEVGHDGGR